MFTNRNNDIFNPFFGSEDFDILSKSIKRSQEALNSKYPPYNIYKEGDTTILEVGTTGFSKSELKVTRKKNNLTIAGNKPESVANKDFITRNLAQRNFTLDFTIRDNVVLNKDITYIDGVLKMTFDEIVPEQDQPEDIEIN